MVVKLCPKHKSCKNYAYGGNICATGGWYDVLGEPCFCDCYYPLSKDEIREQQQEIKKWKDSIRQ